MDAKIVLLACFFLTEGFAYLLTFLNLRYLRKEVALPADFGMLLDADLLKKTRAYTAVRSSFSLIESLFSAVLLIVFLYGGIFDRYTAWVASLSLPFPLQGAVYFLLLSYISTIFGLPFGMYGTFRIENRFGFNTMSIRLWIIDLCKSLALTTVIVGTLLAVGFWIVQASPDFWWLFVWGFFLLFSIFMMYLAPYVIEPLFHTFTPLEDQTLQERISAMLRKAGIRVSRVFVMDASRRSTHTNAYFTGIGRVKRIVLYDTLMKRLDADEVLAVLAHEAGHWKKKHVLKMIVLVETAALGAAYGAFRLLASGLPGRVFDLSRPSFFADLVVLGVIFSIISVPLTPLMSSLSRRHEKEADRFATELSGMPQKLATSLMKLTRDNLANLRPHPLYAWWYYSHPPVLERVKALKEAAQ